MGDDMNRRGTRRHVILALAAAALFASPVAAKKKEEERQSSPLSPSATDSWPSTYSRCRARTC